MGKFADWGQFASWLDKRGLFHMELGQARMHAALAALGLTRPPFAIVQILGTNGKGSTCAFLDSLARMHGLKTGLYTSPHFVSPKERIRVNGGEIADALWLKLANAIFSQDNNAFGLTYFEFLTVLAILAFRELNVGLAILEAGLGGLNDATSALPADMHLFTPIAMDHAAIIGPGICDIARDKAAAIKPDSRVFSAPQYPAVASILKSAAALAGSSLAQAPPMPAGWRTGIAGGTARINAALALAAWRALAPLCGNMASDSSLEREAINSAFLPGRMQNIPPGHGLPRLILDGAHNPHAMAALIRNLQGLEPPAAIIFSALGDKNWQATLGPLRRNFPQIPFFIPQMTNPRAADAQRLAAFGNSLASGGNCLARPSLAEALEMAREFSQGGQAVLLTGSLYLLAEFHTLYPEYLHKKL